MHYFFLLITYLALSIAFSFHAPSLLQMSMVAECCYLQVPRWCWFWLIIIIYFFCPNICKENAFTLCSLFFEHFFSLLVKDQRSAHDLTWKSGTIHVDPYQNNFCVCCSMEPLLYGLGPSVMLLYASGQYNWSTLNCLDRKVDTPAQLCIIVFHILTLRLCGHWLVHRWDDICGHWLGV